MKPQIRGTLIGCLSAGLAASGGLAAERTVTLEVGSYLAAVAGTS